MAFASECLPSAKAERIEWIDDTSANLIYTTPEVARDALLAFSSIELLDISQLPALQSVPARSLVSKPQSKLEVRLAVVGDRKQAGARDRSRFYLLNPEHDPAERVKNHRGPKSYRARESSGYSGRRYDEHEDQKRRKGDEDSGFNASLYDDDEAALAFRANRNNNGHHSRSSSGSDTRDKRGRRVRFKATTGRELFPNHIGPGEKENGRLRDRSASPVRDREQAYDRTRQDATASANRMKGQSIKSQLMGAGGQVKELFPHQSGGTHRLLDEAADETADLFAEKMPVPFLDGAGDSSPRTGHSHESKNSSKAGSHKLANTKDASSIRIRGAGKVTGVLGFSIKGSATEPVVKELFPPPRVGLNADKELFSGQPGGNVRRKQAGDDLFY